jgi:hypothetical protein
MCGRSKICVPAISRVSCSFPLYTTTKAEGTNPPTLGINTSTKTEGTSNSVHTHSHLPNHFHPLQSIPTSNQLTTSSSCAPEESAVTLPAPTTSKRLLKKSCVSREVLLLPARSGSGCSSTNFPTTNLAPVGSALKPTNARWLSRMVFLTRKTSLSNVDKVILHDGVPSKKNY